MVKGKRARRKDWSLKDLSVSAREHFGKIIDNTNLQQWFDIGIMGGLALLGWDATDDPRGALIGPIGYKLATTMGGTPPVSQIAGLGILALLGLLETGGEKIPIGDTGLSVPKPILIVEPPWRAPLAWKPILHP